MIKVNVNGYPIVYQYDTYSLPGHTGAVQWNGGTRRFEVSTGSSWAPIDNNVTLNCDENLTQIIKWAEKKMREEKELEILSKSYPAIQDLMNQIKEKQNQLNMVKTLVYDGSN
jgi:hypothetical protein